MYNSLETAQIDTDLEDHVNFGSAQFVNNLSIEAHQVILPTNPVANEAVNNAKFDNLAVTFLYNFMISVIYKNTK